LKVSQLGVLMMGEEGRKSGFINLKDNQPVEGDMTLA